MPEKQLFDLLIDGTQFTGNQDADGALFVKAKGKNFKKRVEELYYFIHDLLTKNKFEAESSIYGDGSIKIHPFKRSSHDRSIPLSHPILHAIPPLESIMGDIQTEAEKHGFDKGLENVRSDRILPRPESVVVRKPAALQAASPPPVELSDEELRTAIGKGLLGANVPTAIINNAINKAMEEVQKARKEKRQNSLP